MCIFWVETQFLQFIKIYFKPQNSAHVFWEDAGDIGQEVTYNEIKQGVQYINCKNLNF